MAAMTPKDLRDIAAYFGAPFRNKNVGDWIGQYQQLQSYQWPVIDGNVLNHLRRAMSEMVQDVEVFKLRLRHLSSLTDEEITECARIDAGGEFLHGGVYAIHRGDDYINASYGNGACIHFTAPEVFYNYDAPYYQVGQLVAYLQSIGVYVPGTISEEYVELIP